MPKAAVSIEVRKLNPTSATPTTADSPSGMRLDTRSKGVPSTMFIAENACAATVLSSGPDPVTGECRSPPDTEGPYS
jgi:hypothetical protein